MSEAGEQQPGCSEPPCETSPFATLGPGTRCSAQLRDGQPGWAEVEGFAQGHTESARDAGAGPEPTSRMLGLRPDTALPFSHLASRVNRPKGFWGNLIAVPCRNGGRGSFDCCCCTATEMSCPPGPSVIES